MITEVWSARLTLLRRAKNWDATGLGETETGSNRTEWAVGPIVPVPFVFPVPLPALLSSQTHCHMYRGWISIDKCWTGGQSGSRWGIRGVKREEAIRTITMVDTTAREAPLTPMASLEYRPTANAYGAGRVRHVTMGRLPP